jgi:hypothetical protein
MSCFLGVNKTAKGREKRHMMGLKVVCKAIKQAGKKHDLDLIFFLNLDDNQEMKSKGSRLNLAPLCGSRNLARHIHRFLFTAWHMD